VGPTLSPDLLATLVEAAHALALPVTAHVHGLDELRKAVDAGVDELAHMLLSDDAIPDRLLDRMVEQGMAVVPTLSIRFGPERTTAIENLARFWARGGSVIYGTDLGNEGPRPGIEPSEIEGMSQAGIGARAIISSATVLAARHLGLRDRGVVEVGRRADLIGVEGDPLEEPRALERVRFVMRAGRMVKNEVTR
jgi:imidazolonepropionase-like amidohydrolase